MKLAEAPGISGRFVVGYIGTHGLAHSLETMVEAARAAEGKEEFSDVYFITVGSGACFEALRRRASDLSNFRMIGQIKHDDIFKYWSILMQPSFICATRRYSVQSFHQSSLKPWPQVFRCFMGCGEV